MQDAPTGLKTYQTYIDGKWVDAVSGKRLLTSDPYTGEPWAEIPECEAADVDRAVEAAYHAFDGGPWSKLTQTARYADYVIPPKLAPEYPTLTYDFEELESHAPGWGYPLPYAAYREALVDPPAGSELLEDWELFYYLGREQFLANKRATGRRQDLADLEALGES